ncbi:hypothetical protein BDW68DRAFT_174551 [Aspergillus falconensis]
MDSISESIGNVHTVVRSTARDFKETAQAVELQKLPVAEGAEFGSYMDQHGEECLPGTRTDPFRNIEEWGARSPDGKCISWLYGLAGTGKTTVSRSTLSLFQRERILAEGIFFKRGEGNRGNATRFFSTVARQLANVPELHSAIVHATTTVHPSLFNISLLSILALLPNEVSAQSYATTDDVADSRQINNFTDSWRRTLGDTSVTSGQRTYVAVSNSARRSLLARQDAQ